MLEENFDCLLMWVFFGYVLKVKGDINDVIVVYEMVVKYNKSFGDVYWSLVNMKIYIFSDEMLV